MRNNIKSSKATFGNSVKNEVCSVTADMTKSISEDGLGKVKQKNCSATAEMTKAIGEQGVSYRKVMITSYEKYTRKV